MPFMIPDYVQESFAVGDNKYGEPRVVPWEYRHDVEWDGKPEKEFGWWAHLTAPGYMDQTEWSGPYDTLNEAKEYIEETYEVDPDTGAELLDENDLAGTDSRTVQIFWDDAGLDTAGWAYRKGRHESGPIDEDDFVRALDAINDGERPRERDIASLRREFGDDIVFSDKYGTEVGELFPGYVWNRLGASSEVWRAVNWMDRDDMQSLLENYGFAVYDDESTQDLRNAIAANVGDGTIPESALEG